jgi:arylsulfatase A-like enzyme
MFLNDAYLPEEELCLAEVFKENGYNTGYIGKWYLDGQGRFDFTPPERRQGFDCAVSAKFGPLMIFL